MARVVQRRGNLFGFGKAKGKRASTKRTTYSSALLKQAHDQGFKGVGGIRSDELFNEWVGKHNKDGQLDRGFVGKLREAYWRGEKDAEKVRVDAGVYKGKRIVKVGTGEYQVPSVDPESRFESVAEARRFIEANPMKNPKTVSMSFAASIGYHPPHPERTAKKSGAGIGGDVTFQEWTSRAAMLKTLEMQGRRAGRYNDWKAVVPFGQAPGDYGDNPAASPAQYRLAQAVLSGTVVETGMDKATAREIVDRAPAKLRREYSKRNPMARYSVITGARTRGTFESFEDAHRFGTGLAHSGVHSGYVIRDLVTGEDARFTRTGAVNGPLANPKYQVIETRTGKVVHTDLNKKEAERIAKDATYMSEGARFGKPTKHKVVEQRSNPADESATVYEEFHGRPSTSTVELEESVHYHGNLAELGVLCGLKVRTLSGWDVTLEFGSGKGQAANPQGFTWEYLPSGYIKILVDKKPDKELWRQIQTFVRDKGVHAEVRNSKTGNKYDVISPNPRGKDKRQGPLTSAYEFGTGAVHGVLGEADRVLGKAMNPDHGPVLLCSNEARNQLYLRGGDQSLDLSAIHMDDHHRDSMVIGTVWALCYVTRKEFDKGQEIEYVHVLGPEKFHIHMPKRADLWEDAEPPKDAAFEGGYLPVLRYDTLNKQLSLDGGVYSVKDVGITD